MTMSGIIQFFRSIRSDKHYDVIASIPQDIQSEKIQSIRVASYLFFAL